MAAPGRSPPTARRVSKPSVGGRSIFSSCMLPIRAFRSRPAYARSPRSSIADGSAASASPTSTGASSQRLSSSPRSPPSRWRSGPAMTRRCAEEWSRSPSSAVCGCWRTRPSAVPCAPGASRAILRSRRRRRGWAQAQRRRCWPGFSRFTRASSRCRGRAGRRRRTLRQRRVASSSSRRRGRCSTSGSARFSPRLARRRGRTQKWCSSLDSPAPASPRWRSALLRRATCASTAMSAEGRSPASPLRSKSGSLPARRGSCSTTPT